MRCRGAERHGTLDKRLSRSYAPQVSYSYLVAAHSGADAHAVFGALIRPATWPIWSPLDAAEVEGGADPNTPRHIGDIVIFHVGSVVSREQIVDLVTDRRYVYDNLGGPFRSYRGVIELAPAAGQGTDITWAATFEPKVPLSGLFWQWYLKGFMQRMANGLASYAAGGESSKTGEELGAG